MDVMDIYKSECEYYLDYVEEAKTKYDWAAEAVFGLVTYNSNMNEFLVKKIIEVCKVILDKRAHEYLINDQNKLTYILVCQILNQKRWIDWGPTILGCWFDSADILSHDGIVDHQSFAKDNCEIVAVPFSETNLRKLIAFIER
mgnify:CR=1 FL=1